MPAKTPSNPSPPPALEITGLGLVTPLGRNAWETFAALLDGRTLADRAANLPESVGPVDLVRALGCVANAQHDPVDPAVAIAEAAAREAATMADVPLDGLSAWIATSKGAVAAATPNAARPLLVQPKTPTHHPDTGQPLAPADPRAVLARPGLAEALALGPHATLTHHLARRTGIAPVSHQVAACASSLFALHHAAGHLRRLPEPQPGASISALVVTAEASLLPAFIASYQRLGVLAPLTRESYRQTPLAGDRHGFMLAETAAAVVLTRRHPDDRTADAPTLTLVDTAVANETYDLIRPSHDMPALRHLAASLFAGRKIDGLHPHAPGTEIHDPAELQALADVLNAEREMTQAHDPVHVYASKGALGHALGASGLAALVIAALCLTAGKRPPMPWLAEPDTRPMTPCPIPVAAQEQALPRTGAHAVFAAGFAGHTAGAVVKRAMPL
ncbi:MAG: beta-ketoacyl synthase N-terminal-like domain-containing protein [Planctomycetota bacterium]